MSDIQPTEQDHHEEQTALELALRNCMTWLSANVTTVIYGLAAVLAIAAVVVFMQRKPAGNPEASRLLLTASTPEEFQDIADSAPTSLLGMWARLRQGDRHMDLAVPNMFVDREKAQEDLKAAKSAYDNLGSQSGLTKRLRERVYIGLARISECECDGTKESLETVKTAWEQVLAVDEESIVKDHAESRIASLEKPATAEFYKWFAALNPKPLLPGAAGNVPEIPDGLLPNDFPGAAPSEEATSETPEETAKGDESAEGEAVTGDESEAAATEAPAADKPAVDKPAVDKPAVDKPAVDKPAVDKEDADKEKEDVAEEVKATEAADAKPDTAKTDGDN